MYSVQVDVEVEGDVLYNRKVHMKWVHRVLLHAYDIAGIIEYSVGTHAPLGISRSGNKPDSTGVQVELGTWM